MMSSCASIQVNIDSGDAATLARRWDARPPHRPGRGGRLRLLARRRCTAPSGWPTWNAMDPTRTKPVLASGRLAEDWTDYVLDGPADAPARGRRQLRARGGADHLRRVGRRGHRRPPAHARRPRLPLHHAVPAGAAPRLARGALARLPARRPRRGGQRGRHGAAHRRARRATRPSRRARPSTGVASWTTTASLGTRDPDLAAAGGRDPRGAPREALDRTPAPPRWAEAVADAGERWPAKGRSPGRRPRGAPAPRARRCSTWPTRPVEVSVARDATVGRRWPPPSAASRARVPRDPRALRRGRAAPPARHPHVAAAVGPRPRRQLRGPLARAGPRRRADPRRASTTSTTPSSSRAGSGRRCRCSTSPQARAYGDAVRGPRPRPARPRPTSARTAPTRSCATASCTAWSCSTSTSTPRRCSPRSSSCPRDEGHVLTAPAPPGRRASRRPPRCSSPAGPSRWAPTHPSAYDNERPAPRASTSPAFWIDAAPVTNGQYRRFVDDGGYDDPRWWSERGLGVAAGGRPRRAAVLAARRRRVVRACGSAPSSRCPTTSRCSTSAGTRPTPTPAGPASACPPRPSGRRPPRSTRPPASSRRWPWGDDDPDRRPRQPRAAPPRPGAGRRLPGRA